MGHLKLKDTKPVHVQHFVNQLQSLEVNTKSKRFAPSTVKRYYTVLQSIMHSAYKLGIIEINPADGDRITLPKLQEQTTEIFTPEEVQELLSRLESEPLQFKVLIHLALNTGCRRGELVGLKWSDINFTTGVLNVQRSNVASRLGHSQLKTTDRYVNAIEEADRQAANAFEGMFNTSAKRA